MVFIFTIFIFYLNFRELNKKFTFAMLDIGQGDALFVEAPSGIQVLIDGGPPKKILGELNKVMLPFDKKIDVLMITNPDQDHIGGLIDILENYEVDIVLESGTFNSSKTYKDLKNKILEKNIPNILARAGMVLYLDSKTKIEILFPNQDVSAWENNDGSIIARLTYGNFSILLTGDATKKTEQIILAENIPKKLKSNILKVGHHGSRTSTSSDLLKIVQPEHAFISVGLNNKYGHPASEVLDLLEKFRIEILRTDESGTIILKCDKMEVCKIKKLKN